MLRSPLYQTHQTLRLLLNPQSSWRSQHHQIECYWGTNWQKTTPAAGVWSTHLHTLFGLQHWAVIMPLCVFDTMITSFTVCDASISQNRGRDLSGSNRKAACSHAVCKLKLIKEINSISSFPLMKLVSAHLKVDNSKNIQPPLLTLKAIIICFLESFLNLNFAGSQSLTVMELSDLIKRESTKPVVLLDYFRKCSVSFKQALVKHTACML